MKIAQVCPYDFSRPGGVKNHVIDLSEALILQGHQVEVITPSVENYDADIQLEIHYIGRRKSTSSRSTKVDYSIVFGSEFMKLNELLKSKNYDIIHYHNAWTPLLTWQVRLLSFFKKNKNIATFHDTPKDTFVGKYIIGKMLMPFGALIMSMLGSAAISVSESQAKYVRKFSLKPFSIIPNGIDLKMYDSSHAQMEEYEDGMFNLLFMGRIEPRKGLGYALQAFEKLKQKYSNLRLIVAGDGDDRGDAELYVKEKKLVDVEFLGFVDEPTKYALLRTAHMYLAPALFGESFGIVLLEAMAAGIPMVGFGNDGYKNVISCEWMEYFPKPRDQQAFIDKIEKLYLNPKERADMMDWGKEEVKKYDWNILSQQVLQVYKKVLIS